MYPWGLLPPPPPGYLQAQAQAHAQAQAQALAHVPDRVQAPTQRRRPFVELTFAGISDHIRGCMIGKGGAIQKLLTGRSAKKLDYRLDFYRIVDDGDSLFKIMIGGAPGAVLRAQDFVFRLVTTSHKKAANSRGIDSSGIYPWEYIPGDHCFLIEYSNSEWWNRRQAPAPEPEQAKRPTSSKFGPSENRSCLKRSASI